MLVEQAVYTSARTSRLNGYQLVATSSGITEADAKDLSQWGPAHDSLRDDVPSGASINFFGLHNGDYCLSRTTLAGSEYSGRGGDLIYTQCFKISAELLLKFANNPIRVMEAIIAAGRCQVQLPFPTHLESFRLVGGAKAVDEELLSQLSVDPGAASMGLLASSVADDEPFCVVAAEPAHRLIGGLLNLMPIACRTELSFTTGLEYSARRPFRLHIHPTIDRSKAAAYQRSGIHVVDLNRKVSVEELAPESWGDLVQRTLATRSIEVWPSLLQHCEACESPDDLNVAAEACSAVLLS